MIVVLGQHDKLNDQPDGNRMACGDAVLKQHYSKKYWGTDLQPSRSPSSDIYSASVTHVHRKKSTNTHGNIDTSTRSLSPTQAYTSKHTPTHTYLARLMRRIHGDSPLKSSVFLLKTSTLLTLTHSTALSSALGGARTFN